MNPIKKMHVYLRAGSIHTGTKITSVPWPWASSWCGKEVRFSETVNLRGDLSGVEICEACANAIEHGARP